MFSRLNTRLGLLSMVVGLVVAAGLFVASDRAFCKEESKGQTITGEIFKFLKEQKVSLNESKIMTMAKTIYQESHEQGVDYRLVLAIIRVESNFKPHITARDGSTGLMQLQPSLAKGIARKKGETFTGSKDLKEPEKNIKFGTYHVAKLMEDYDNVAAALHVYNAGAQRAKLRLAREEEPDTPFVKKVLHEYYKYTAILPEP